MGGAGEVKNILSVGWSPDGHRLAYIEHNGVGHIAGQPFVTVLDLDTGDRSSPQCGIPHTQSIDWATHSDSLLTNDCDGSMAILATDSTVLVALPASDSATWSPSGTELLYRTGSELWFYEMANGSSHLLLESFTGFDLRWQPAPVFG